LINSLLQSIVEIKSEISDAKNGLPTEIFGLVSELTPLVNVDLLIKNERGQTLLTWRADEYYGASWHIPGGIIRFKEKASVRIAKVADSELSATVSFIESPINLAEIISDKRDYRGHFISLMYLCKLTSDLPPQMDFTMCGEINGAWKWHDFSPKNLISPHCIFRDFIDSKSLLNDFNFK
jgi:ADP-ribose pyrophosphatase YjhB (NUDIX family)